jgi:DNA-binding MarR family transcriptional regulator
VFEDDNVVPIHEHLQSGEARAATLVQQIIERTNELQALVDDRPIEAPAGQQPFTTYSQFARLLLRERRDRDLVLLTDMLGDPAWDMVLDLFAAGEDGKRIPVSSICLAAGVPPTTALRWLALLVEKQLIVRTDDARDKRRVNVSLTPATRTAMISYLDRIATRRRIRLSAQT